MRSVEQDHRGCRSKLNMNMRDSKPPHCSPKIDSKPPLYSSRSFIIHGLFVDCDSERPPLVPLQLAPSCSGRKFSIHLTRGEFQYPVNIFLMADRSRT